MSKLVSNPSEPLLIFYPDPRINPNLIKPAKLSTKLSAWIASLFTMARQEELSTHELRNTKELFMCVTLIKKLHNTPMLKITTWILITLPLLTKKVTILNLKTLASKNPHVTPTNDCQTNPFGITAYILRV